MMWNAGMKPLAAVASALILATAGAAVQGRQEPGPKRVEGVAPPVVGEGASDPAEANRDLARQQLAMADEALAVLRELARTGRTSLSNPAFSLWGRRRLEALRKAGTGKAEMVATLEKAVEELKQDEAVAKAQVESARGTQVDLLDVRYRRIEIETWLNEEKAR